MNFRRDLMKKEKDIKVQIKEKYGKIALNAKSMQNSCGCNCCSSEVMVDYTIMSDSYDKVDGYQPEADLGLGCGLPTEFANIKEGDTVLDLGCGAGNDAFIARRIVGDKGLVVGLDMTQEMIDRAILNCYKLGYTNIEFILGEIEDIPLKSNFIDVVISNCVLNLVPNKEKAFSEIHRVLRSGGHFCVSDIVLTKELPNVIKNEVDMYTGCISGSIALEDYLEIINKCGFIGVEIKKIKNIDIPISILKSYLSDEDLEKYNYDLGIKSITVNGNKA